MNKALSVFIIVLIGLALNLPAQSLVITAPNGGETLTLGQPVQITWTASNVSQKVKLQLIKSGGALVGVIAGNLNATPGTFPWTVGQYQGGSAEAGGNYKIRVRLQDGNIEDASNGAFTIVAGAATPAPAPPPPPAGLNVSQSGGIQMKPLKVTREIVPYAVITSFTVDGHPASGVYHKCYRAQGVLCQANAVSLTRPILYRYALHLIGLENGSYAHVVHQTPWIEQNNYTFTISQAAAMDAVYGDGNYSMVPISLFGRVYVEVKNATQTESPQMTAIGIQLYL